jgi:aminoglycoside phosphotransferase family enzyme
LAKERIPIQSAAESGKVQESRLETILKAIAGVHDSVDERLTLVQEAIDQVPDVGQVKEAASEEVREVVQEQLKVTVQREIVHAIGDEITSTVQ